MQKVYFGYNGMNRPCLFTNGVAAWYLRDSDLPAFEADPDAFCQRLNFEYVTRPRPLR